MHIETKVLFRIFPDGDVIAIFPDDICDYEGNYNSYQHVGQHGACSPLLVDELRPAKPKEYKALLEELKAIGYENIKVIK